MGRQSINTEQLRDGSWWVDEVGGFHCAEGVDDSFDSLFLRHLGQLKLDVSANQVSITWDVHEVSLDTITCVISRLNQSTSNSRVYLRYYYFGWADELYSGPNAATVAAQRIGKIQRFRSVEMVRPTQINVHDLSSITTATPSIKRGFDMWRETNGQLGNASQEACSEHLPSFLIYRPDRHTGKLVFSWVGTRSLSAVVHGRTWAALAIKQSSTNPQGAEKQDYVAQISSAYQHVWDSGEPQYSSIRTLLTPEGQDPRWLSYERLLMRYNLHDGRPALVCLAKQSHEINIPLTAVT